MSNIETLAPSEAVQLGAVDPLFYCRYFFPRTVRQEFPEFATGLWHSLEDPRQRYVSFEIFRDGAKTSTCRLFASKRIAYGISHNIVYTSNSERHAARSVDWIARQVEHNTLWSQTFGLRKGGKWSETEIEIIQGIEEFPVRVIAVGITGQVRGINFDDYRPDLVVGDDLDNEETTGTPEQREKANALFFGALIRGLAQPTDIPDAKAVLLATPLAHGDIVETCRQDPLWESHTISCFNQKGESSWPAKFPTDYLLREKQAYIDRGQLGLWMREMECKIVSEELASFRLDWLFTWETLPDGAWFFVAIDPAISDSKTADDFAIGLFAVYGGKVCLWDAIVTQGVMPDMAMAYFWGWQQRYFIRYIIVESVAFQKVLAWYFKREMDKRRIYVPIRQFDDRRRKDDRILQHVLAFAPHGQLGYRKGVEGISKFLSQYIEWRPGAKIKDDALDMVSIGLASVRAEAATIEGEFRRIEEDEKGLVPLKPREDALCP